MNFPEAHDNFLGSAAKTQIPRSDLRDIYTKRLFQFVKGLLEMTFFNDTSEIEILANYISWIGV